MDTHRLECSADSDTDLGDAVDVRMSHTFTLTFSVYHQQHTRYVMRLGKYTISISELCLCVYMCVCSCLFSGQCLN